MRDTLPSKNQVLQACRGSDEPGHPLLRAAHDLTALHERLLCAEPDELAELDTVRTHLVHDIDRWVTAQLPPSHGAARVHTETLGAVIDRLARLTAAAYAALARQSGRELTMAWEHLAELAVGYEDLASEVCTGRRRLPGTH
ncbi:DUF4254 domain-containing protein [Nocardia seriolae]|uniref:Uncharacterized protein n=1 Tax=Nocardia seriolae TaxID=37332 RepID=A0A0B8NQ70_9NOCA|nr:DUF4254 domain-containing protein [Nocardia seriolae]APA95502.1 hypothetical protein NS506_01431 [Nocardia seriolae]MTJ66358.1 DUF4254 domain-containing protein [Nocardia seriolae]MTJ75935.1 DUF4254 domain-containing protein [Nocardia seriolae]MTJ85732.1 DUF4254 domain-containing protein [Nocardia seriolae]MTK29731.1 DUF4254 domain-containing protein [Nocardia seriolae]